MKILRILLVILSVLSSAVSENNNSETAYYSEKAWGAGILFRKATVPYADNEFSDDKSTTTIIPLLYYQGEHFYMDGTEMGYRLDINDSWSTSVFTRLRLTDLPLEIQNEVEKDSYDPGLQLRYAFEEGTYLDLELMSDYSGAYYINLAYEKMFDLDDFEIKPYAVGTYRSSEFNSKYYGLNNENLSGGIDLSLGASIRYHLYGNIYLLANVQTKFLSVAAGDSTFVKERRQDEASLGIAVFHNKDKALKESLSIKPFIQIAYGFATPSDLANILSGDKVDDEYDNRMVSIFYGHPVTDRLFSLPMDLYLTPGVAWHFSSEVQNSIQEYVIALRAYYALPLPWRIRLGVAEGASYVSEATYVEGSELEEKGYVTSNLLNYLGFSVDLSLGDIFGKTVEGLWLGYDIHHRSGIFESSPQFGGLKGGSNYTTVYLQYHY